MLRALLIAAFASAWATSPASGLIFVETSYETFVVQHNQQLYAIAGGHSLSPQDSQLAIRAATLFIYFGPCEGSSKDIPGPPIGSGWMQYLSLINPNDQTQAAALEMIAAMIVPSLGRHIPKDSFLCRFALGMAQPTWDGSTTP
jgi:hypothetical protein